MATIFAETNDTAVPVGLTVSDNSGGVSGLTVDVSAYDAENSLWLDFNDNSWSATPTTQTKVAPASGATGGYGTTINISNTSATVSLTVFYEVSGTLTALVSDKIMLGMATRTAGSVWDEAAAGHVAAGSFGDLMDAIDTVTSTNLDTTVGSRAVAGDEMNLVNDAITAAKIAANAIGAAELATDAVTEIRNSILADGAAFNGASIATILASTGAITTHLTDIKGATFSGSTDSLEAIRDQGDAAWTTGVGGTPSATADAVWDALAASYNTAGSMGELLHAAGGAFTPADVADAVWDELVAGHAVSGSFSALLGDILTDTGEINTAVQNNLDAPVSTRAVAGDDMNVATVDANAITAAALATDAVTEIRDAITTLLSSTHGAGSWATATGFATPGAAMTLTTAEKGAIVDDIWNEPQAGHVITGTFGKFLDSEVSTAGGGATPSQVADAVWDEERSGHTSADTFGAYLDQAVSSAGDPAANAAAVWNALRASYTAAGSFGQALDAQVSTRAADGALMGLTSATRSLVVDDIWNESRVGHTTTGTFGYYIDSQVSSAGGADTAAIADAVWDEILSGQHDAPNSAGVVLQGAGGAFTPSDVADAVWDEAIADHINYGTSGSALNTAGVGSADLYRTVSGLQELVLRYTPTVVQAPITTKSQVRNGDVGVILEVPILRDGVLSDLSDATTITFKILSPAGTVPVDKLGIAVTHSGGAYATYTSESDIFNETGRWRAYVHVLWSDMSETTSQTYSIDVIPTLTP